jgi:small GTP-binding protein
VRLAPLSPADEALLGDERRFLAELAEALERLDATPEARLALRSAMEQLDGLFLLVVVGEFNAGKSAFINALVGETILEEGVTPTTAQVHVLQFGDERGRAARTPTLHVITAPVPLLRDLHIVDTPGTNAVIREHEAITAEFVPRADIVLFVTSADRPFTETERQFLQGIREWGKKVVIVLNKVDLFERDEELDQVLAFVHDQAQRLLGAAPDVFPVSARLALRAKRGEPAAWAGSRFEGLERFIVERLDERERLRLKLASPLGVANALTARYSDVVIGRLELLKDDVRLLEDVEQQLGVHRTDLETQFSHRMTAIDNALLEMEARGHEYFDEMLRLGRVFDLFNRARVQAGFEQQVVGDTPAQVERHVSEMVDWLVASDLQQWQSITRHLADRRRQYSDRIIGDPELASFHTDRARLVESVGREAQRVVERFDRQREAQALAESARSAVATTAAVGAGALGLGAAVTFVATTAAADVTGILAASLVAAMGLFVIPSRRRKAKADMREKISGMRELLSRSLRDQFQREMQRSRERVDASIGPYSRFVRAERGSLEATRELLDGLQDRLAVLRARIEQLGTRTPVPMRTDSE